MGTVVYGQLIASRLGSGPLRCAMVIVARACCVLQKVVFVTEHVGWSVPVVSVMGV